MRTFYIFKIKKEIAILTKEIPYNLFKMIENLYYLDSSYTDLSFNLYNNLFSIIDKEYVDNRLNNLFKNNRHYEFSEGIHIINNKYKPEESYLKVYKSHIILKSNVIYPSLLVNYLSSDNLFVCDFKYKDYFWLNEIIVKN